MNLNSFLILFLVTVLFFSCADKKKAELAFKKSIYQTLSLEERRKPENALLALETHPGLEVTLFASEPMVTNPTNIDVDARGRVWVCEAYNYGLTESQVKEKGGRSASSRIPMATDQPIKRRSFTRVKMSILPWVLRYWGIKSMSPAVLICWFLQMKMGTITGRKGNPFYRHG